MILISDFLSLVTLYIAMPESLTKESAFYAKGLQLMSTNTAFNIYVRQVVRNRSIPFTIEAPSKDDVMAKGRAAFYRMRQAAAEAGMQDMPLDEINEEIRLVREGR